MTAPSALASAPRQDERRFLETLTGDPEQGVIMSVITRPASCRRADRAHPRVRRRGARILTRTDARDRVQAVIFAYDTGLVRPA
ncbi:hypothetical protein ABZ864_20185 [Streptomyces sp. NPDC047082]|uniref:hypothetical protein n=1 Tax=Streptomyces sp. NPDC047082 TaxID=3155259 RepID=UPI0033DC5517